MTETTEPQAPAVGTLLRHYKGGLYRVEGHCRIEATLETGVLYRACQGDGSVLWLRPLAEFGQTVLTEQGPRARFEEVASEALTLRLS
jgi:hypothetical protein